MSPPSVGPIQRSIQNFEIQNRIIKHGPVVATSHVGSANWLRPEKAWMIFAFTKSLRGELPFGIFFVRRVSDRTDGTKNLGVASLVREGPGHEQTIVSCNVNSRAEIEHCPILSGMAAAQGASSAGRKLPRSARSGFKAMPFRN